jgi:Bacteriophage tail sheath protein
MPTYTAPGVYIEEVPSSSRTLESRPTSVAAFVGFTERAPSDDPNDPLGMAPRLVTSWTQFEELYGGFAPNCMLPISIYGYFANGGALAYICRIPNSEPAGKPAKKELPASDRALGQPLSIESLKPDANILVEVRTDDLGDSPGEGPATFTLIVVENGEAVETWPNLDLGSGDRNAKTVVNGKSTKIKVDVALKKGSDLNSQLELMKPGLYSLEKATPIPVPVTGRKFAGSETARAGIGGLALAEDVTIVVVPDLITAATKEDGSVDLNMWKAVQTSLISHCEQQGNRMALLDCPPGMSPQQIKDWRSDVAMYDSQYAALYYPWVKVENPIGQNGNREILIPPSGHMAGLWARTDDERGVWKAPANDILRGVLDVERSISQNEQSVLNPIGVNCIRPFGTRGIRVWGARTLSSNTDWRYINVRRLFNMIETTIMQGTQFAVFEPNDQELWDGVSRTVGAFLRGLWMNGALFGASTDEAYYVKCDEETNPPESIDEGKMIVEVGIAPVKPAEFVVFRIAQHKQTSA